ncbi:MAG: HrpE/YscL family type III secretion apparatus protein [Victivallales bacterium]|nr:HrpE/YscL family type III secretion apparatus protein [Victivallales bacterium]
MLLIKKNNFEIQTPIRLVKAEEVASVLNAQELISAAEEEAARIREAAKTAFEEERRRGYEKGLEDGKAAIVARKLELLDESVAFMESVEDKMVGIVMTALKKCVMEIGEEEMVVQIVRKVMNAVVRTQRHITLKVAPEMVSVVKGRLDEIMQDYPMLDEIDVIDDSRLKGASCMLETEAGIADASIDTQLTAIENSMRKHFSKEG